VKNSNYFFGRGAGPNPSFLDISPAGRGTASPQPGPRPQPSFLDTPLRSPEFQPDLRQWFQL